MVTLISDGAFRGYVEAIIHSKPYVLWIGHSKQQATSNGIICKLGLVPCGGTNSFRFKFLI
jgi:hypothetical protein